MGKSSSSQESGAPPTRGLSLTINNHSLNVQPKNLKDRTVSREAQIHQLAALLHCYRASLAVLVLTPILLLVIPPVLFVFLTALDFLTNGFSGFAIVFTLGFTVAGYGLIFKLSPTPQKAEEAFHRNEISLPLLMAAISILLTSQIVAPILRHFSSSVAGSFLSALLRSFNYDLTLTSPIPQWKLAISTFLLGISVVARYVGPLSIMRASSVPLWSNPFDSNLRSFWKNPLAMAEGPQPPPHSRQGRRFQRVTIQSMLVHILLLLLISFLVFQCTATEYSTTTTLLRVSLSIVFPFCAKSSMLSHEIDPRLYLSNHGVLSFKQVVGHIKTSLFMSVPITFVSIIASRIFDDHAWFYMSWLEPISQFTGAFLVVVYTSIFEDVLLTVLFHLPDPMTLVEELGFPRNEMSLQMTLLSLIPDRSMVSYLQSPITAVGVTRLDEIEKQRSMKMIHELALSLLSKSSVPEAPFEEDLIHLLVLQALIRPSVKGVTVKGTSSIADWLDVSLKQRTRDQPMIVVVLRCLLIRCGAIGKALEYCSSTPSYIPGPTESCKLSPTLLLCCELVLNSITEVFSHSLDLSLRSDLPVDWLKSHTRLQISVGLTAAFQLHRGLKMFTGNTDWNPLGPKSISDVASRHPQVVSVLRSCDTLVRSLASRLQKREKELLPLEHEVRAWVDDTVAKKL